MEENKKRLNVGVFICHIDTEYVRNMCNGILHAAEDMDVNVIFFPGMYVSAYYDPTHLAEYDYQLNTIYDYAIRSHIDILIISLGTIEPFIDYSDIDNFINKYKDSTIIIMEEDIPGRNCLTINNVIGFQACLEHMIVDHGYKKICFVNGKHNNNDSAERLSLYLEMMKKYNLPVDVSMTPYGNYSKYCDAIIQKMLDKNPDTEAICFANDYMAEAGYRVLKKRGLEIGKDIAITGFDNASFSNTLSPPLSTVGINIQELAYRAVIEGINIFNGGTMTCRSIPSKFIRRSSCGCDSEQTNLYVQCGQSLDECINIATAHIMFHSQSELLYRLLRPLVADLFSAYYEYDGNNHTLSEFQEMINKLKTASWSKYIKTEHLHYYIHDFILRIIDLTSDSTRKAALNSALLNLLSSSINDKSWALYSIPIDFMNIRWISSGIMRDSLIYNSDTDIFLEKILEKIELLGITSSYIYLFDAPVVHNLMDEWKRPSHARLVAFSVHDKKVVLNSDDSIISIREIFDNNYTDRPYQHIKTIYNLFINEDQYGFFICENDIDKQYAAYTVSIEISSALKYSNMNHRLMNISITDELTRLDNRRGFFEKVNNMILTHVGHEALLFFADLDSLKLINDTFGHEAGDYALMSAATILHKSFRRDDVVARLGGDEFIAFALSGNTTIIEQLKERIQMHTIEMNSSSNVPYYIEMSYGYTSFICSSDILLEEMIKEADHSLYENKKFKRVNPFREPRQ